MAVKQRPPPPPPDPLSEQITLPRDVGRRADEATPPGDDAAPRRAEPVAEGERLGPYRLVRRLGAGGMGEVHEAVDTRDDQRVALKMLFDIDPAAVYRLKREFRKMAEVSHDNLVALHELGHDGERWFFTMELLTGRDLRAALQDAWARAGEAGLRPLIRQLAHGVHALHQAGRVHRDLKPSNALCTADGRVVILDFGLVNEIDHRTLFASSRSLVRGTPGFMAPEQAAGQLATPAADWYAVGVILFEALAGRVPFTGSVMQVILDKQDFDAPRLRSLAPEASPELDELVAALLRRAPAERPGVTEVLAWCAGDRTGPGLTLPRRVPAGELIERDPHLEILRESLARALAGKPVCVDIVGDAGAGKTALVRQFVGALADSAAVFASACSAREAVPFRAFDGLVDAIAGWLLTRIPADEREALIQGCGDNLHALAQIFPVLARVPAIAAHAPTGAPGPAEMRRRAFAGLKTLLFRVSERRPLIVHLDNLQWGDVDSARLLDDLLAPPGAPAMLLLCSYRGDEPSPMLQDLALVRTLVSPAYALQTLEVPALSQAGAAQLALRLTGAPATPARVQLARRIAREAAGLPALVRALVEELDRPGADVDASLAHGDAGGLLRRLVRGRLARVAAEAHEVFGRIAVAGGLTEAQLLRAGPWRADVRALVTQLRAQSLVRSEGDGEAAAVLPYTDPIQEAALAALEPALLRRSHERVARVLIDEHSEDHERIARHLQAGGQAVEAAEYASTAALAAAKALAVDHAAELYRLALACTPGRWALQKRCGAALVEAGRGAEAAPLFLAAADGAPPSKGGRLRRDAAEQYLVNGYLDRGLEILRPLLAAAGVAAPARPREQIAQLVASVDRVTRRGLHLVERSEYEIPGQELDRIDLLWAAGKGLVLGDPLRSADFLAQATYLSLEAGEPRRAARSLALFGTLHHGRGPAGAAMLGEAQRLAEKTGDDYALGLAQICRGLLARSGGEWLRALTELDGGVAHLREHCPGAAFECSLAQGSSLAALEALGELRSLGQRAELLLRQAQEHGDVLSAVLAAMYSALGLLARGEPAAARARVREAQSHWPRAGFHLQHLHALRLEIACDLYEQRPHDAWQRVLAAWPALEQSSFLRVATRRGDALLLRARASLAVLRRAPTGHAHLVDVVAMDADQLAREGLPFLSAHAALLRAGLAVCTGDEPAAGRHLGAAAAGFEAAGMLLDAAAVRRLRARTPAALAREDAHLHMQSVADPAAWLRVVAPGLVS